MPDPTQLDNDVKRYLELDDLKSQIIAEQEQIKERLREGGTQNAPCGVAVSVIPNRRFNADRAREVIPEALLPLCLAEVIDPKKAKAALPPAIYEAAMVEVGAPRVSIR